MDQHIFSFEGLDVNVLVKENEPWFVGHQVATLLGYSNTRDALSKHVDIEDKNTVAIHDGIGNPNKVIINESGLYSLILKSRLPEAKQFKRWVTAEVLPTIRKHGAYMTDGVIQRALTNPDFLIQLATNLKEEQQKRLAAEQVIQKQQPLVTFAEMCMQSNKSLLVREVAKLACSHGIKIGERRLFEKLREWGLFFKNKNEPTQTYVERGYFEVSQGVRETSKGAFTWTTTRITPKGQGYIFNRLKKEGEQQ